MSIVNLALRLVLELCAIAAAAYSGNELAAAVGAVPLGWIAAVGAASAVILLWAAIVAPKTQNGLSPLRKERIGTAIMLTTAAALACAGQPTLAIAFAVLIVVNLVLLDVLGRDALAHMKGVTA